MRDAGTVKRMLRAFGSAGEVVEPCIGCVAGRTGYALSSAARAAEHRTSMKECQCTRNCLKGAQVALDCLNHLERALRGGTWPHAARNAASAKTLCACDRYVSDRAFGIFIQENDE